MNPTQSTVVETRQNPGCLLQILWFAFIGIWLGQAWVAVAWVLMVTIVGIPLGIWMLNRVPKVMALRESPQMVRVSTDASGRVTSRDMQPPQVNIIVRALYFVLIGWWLSALWLEAAYLLCLSIIGLPVGFWMFDRVPAVVSLQQ